MSLAGRMLLRVRQLPDAVPSAWRIYRLRHFEGYSHQLLEIGCRTRFYVPVRSAGRGSLKIGSDNTFGWKTAPRLGSGEILVQPRAIDAKVTIGNGNAFSNSVSLCAMDGISIGDRCLIGDQVAIYDCDFHELDPLNRNRSVGPILPVLIGNNVWLGSRVMVLKGVTIGDNAVVAAGSVVTKSLPASVIAAGIPARIVKAIGI